MKNIGKFIWYYSKARLRSKQTTGLKIRNYIADKQIVKHKKVLTAAEINEYIKKRILSGQPLMVGRFGANELSALKTFDFKISSKYQTALKYLREGAGFFPATEDYGMKFSRLMIDSISSVDVMGIWLRPFEEYYINKYGSDRIETTYLLDLEPWSNPENPWTVALKGKRVLVIHPFSDTIESQYKRRSSIFKNYEILPEFKLKTLRAVQTIAGEKDPRFSDWFQALDWMYNEAMSIDFDVAIIGCGAYGFPLAARLKKAGKQAIHLGGATQLLFGIKGKRWEENPMFEYVRVYMNDNWVYPLESEKPKGSAKVEGGCYWK